MEEGDRVYYVSGIYSASNSNPLKGTVFECQGTITRAFTYGYADVTWDNGRVNSYTDNDLKIVGSKLSRNNPNTAFKSRKRR